MESGCDGSKNGVYRDKIMIYNDTQTFEPEHTNSISTKNAINKITSSFVISIIV